MPSDTPISPSGSRAPGMETETEERPRSVRSAVLLLGTSWSLGAALIFFFSEPAFMHPARVPALQWGVLAVVLAFWGFFLWLIISIGRKGNWPRFVLLAFVAYTCMSMLFQPRYYFDRSIETTVFHIVQLALQGLALCLLFSNSARHWSRRSPTPSPHGL